MPLTTENKSNNNGDDSLNESENRNLLRTAIRCPKMGWSTSMDLYASIVIYTCTCLIHLKRLCELAITALMQLVLLRCVISRMIKPSISFLYVHIGRLIFIKVLICLLTMFDLSHSLSFFLSSYLINIYVHTQTLLFRSHIFLSFIHSFDCDRLIFMLFCCCKKWENLSKCKFLYFFLYLHLNLC